VGGLTVVHALRARSPEVEIRYLGDTARLPYGTKSPHTVKKYALTCLNHLESLGPLSGLVVACNTASAHAVPAIRDYVGSRFPVWGVLEPGAESAAKSSKSGRIGVLATPGTITSGGYEQAIRRNRPDALVVSRPAALLVPLAEEGYTEGPVVDAVLSDYLSPLLDESIDTLVLGCTHYPLLKPAIQRWFREREEHILIVDSAQAAADRVCADYEVETAGQRGELLIMVTDGGKRFREIACRFLGETPLIREVDI